MFLVWWDLWQHGIKWIMCWVILQWGAENQWRCIITLFFDCNTVRADADINNGDEPMGWSQSLLWLLGKQTVDGHWVNNGRLNIFPFGRNDSRAEVCWSHLLPGLNWFHILQMSCSTVWIFNQIELHNHMPQWLGVHYLSMQNHHFRYVH